MQGKRFIESIQLTNFLSYGPEAEAIELQSLNVIIGANASGKSNLLEAFGILQATPRNLADGIRRTGGIHDLLWNGAQPASSLSIMVHVAGDDAHPIQYVIQIEGQGPRFAIHDESIENSHFSYRFPTLPGKGHLNRRPTPEKESLTASISTKPDASVLSQVKYSEDFPELSYLSDSFEGIRLYREFNSGRNADSRQPQRTDLPSDFLSEDGVNLGLILNDLEHDSEARTQIRKRLKEFYYAIEDFSTKVVGGTIQVYIHEHGLKNPIPATRISDGTLRYLYLLAILCHPTPPPLICIEEPELGLHPDIIPALAELLIEASQRTQIIVTTHSDGLVTALSDIPEAVLVCERDNNGTSLKRLDPVQLEYWLEKYSLGHLWLMGALGGVT